LAVPEAACRRWAKKEWVERRKMVGKSGRELSSRVEEFGSKEQEVK
jgi:hypothetical protein